MTAKSFQSRTEESRQKVLEIVEQDQAELCLVWLQRGDPRNKWLSFAKTIIPRTCCRFPRGECPRRALLGDGRISVEKAKEQAKEDGER